MYEIRGCFIIIYLRHLSRCIIFNRIPGDREHKHSSPLQLFTIGNGKEYLILINSIPFDACSYFYRSKLKRNSNVFTIDARVKFPSFQQTITFVLLDGFPINLISLFTIISSPLRI